MKKANLHEAKTHLSKLVDLAAEGEIIIICKAGNPIAKLVAFKAPEKKRTPAIWAGKVTIRSRNR